MRTSFTGMLQMEVFHTCNIRRVIQRSPTVSASTSMGDLFEGNGYTVLDKPFKHSFREDKLNLFYRLIIDLVRL